MKRRLNNEIIKEIMRSLKEVGYSYRDIANILEVSPTLVYRRINDL